MILDFPLNYSKKPTTCPKNVLADHQIQYFYTLNDLTKHRKVHHEFEANSKVHKQLIRWFSKTKDQLLNALTSSILRYKYNILFSKCMFVFHIKHVLLKFIKPHAFKALVMLSYYIKKATCDHFIWYIWIFNHISFTGLDDKSCVRVLWNWLGSNTLCYIYKEVDCSIINNTCHHVSLLEDFYFKDVILVG